MNSSKLVCFACLLLCAFIVCEPRPTPFLNKQTCRHKRFAEKEDWKECKKQNPVADYSAAHYRFADEIRSNAFVDGPMHVATKLVKIKLEMNDQLTLMFYFCVSFT